MNEQQKIGLDDAYAVETPEDNVRLYADWVDTYESEFVTSNGWVTFLRVAELLSQYRDDVSGAVLDVGCGTGIGGVALRQCGFQTLDGIDISAEMLSEAGKKKDEDGNALYRNLIQADLTKTIAIDNDNYGGLVSAGTFTHGHLGPESLDELWRVVAPGATCVISVNASHYDEKGFAAKFTADTVNQTITVLDVVDIDMYTRPQADVPPGNLKAKVMICRNES